MLLYHKCRRGKNLFSASLYLCSKIRYNETSNVIICCPGKEGMVLSASVEAIHMIKMSQSLASQYYSVRNITSLKEMLDSSVDLYRKNTAFLIKKEKGGEYCRICYEQLKNDVEALGTKLLDMGLLGKRIAIIGENCYEWIVAYLAVVNGVGVVVPLDKELNKEEICNIIDTAECNAVFHTNTFRDIFKDHPVAHQIAMRLYGDRTELSEVLPDEPEKDGLSTWEALVGAGEKLVRGGDRRYIDFSLDPEEMRMLLFSSGTTGMAKGIMLSHRNIVNDIMDTRRIVHIKPEDRSLSILPIHHTFELTLGILTLLYSGASIAFYEGLKYVAKNLVEAQATVLLGVPLIFESMYNKIWKQAAKTGKDIALRKAIKFNRFLRAMGISAERKLFHAIHDNFGGKLRLLITGAAAIDPNVCRGYEDIGLKVLQGYGLTECAPLVAGTPDFSDTYKKAGSVGPALPSGRLKIVDPDENGIGEIAYQGPNVMIGYYNMPEETAAVLHDGWFFTGDLGFMDDKGWLYITGRKKNVIVTKTGKNIYPEEIELYVNRSPYIEESMVYGIDEDLDEGTIVGVQIKPAYEAIYEKFGEDYNDDQIYQLLKEEIRDINTSLAVYKRIRNVSIRREDFIKTTTKKIKRHQNL